MHIYPFPYLIVIATLSLFIIKLDSKGTIVPFLYRLLLIEFTLQTHRHPQFYIVKGRVKKIKKRNHDYFWGEGGQRGSIITFLFFCSFSKIGQVAEKLMFTFRGEIKITFFKQNFEPFPK